MEGQNYKDNRTRPEEMPVFCFLHGYKLLGAFIAPFITGLFRRECQIGNINGFGCRWFLGFCWWLYSTDQSQKNMCRSDKIPLSRINPFSMTGI